MIINTIEEAIAYRKQIESLTAYAPAEMAIETPTAYPIWSAESVEYYDGTDGEHPQSKVRTDDESNTLYKCIKSHTSQELWKPGIETASLWTIIDEVHAGTLEDPIPAISGMEYVYGLYYLDPDDNKIYICKRIGESDGGKITLYYLPHELVGQYFELAE